MLITCIDRAFNRSTTFDASPLRTNLDEPFVHL